MNLLEFQTAGVKTYIKNKLKLNNAQPCYVYRDQIEATFDFAWKMTLGHEGEHRSNRSGGILTRTEYQKFDNTFQGKLAEYAVYNYFKRNGCTSTEPDLTVMKLGEWDKFDFIVNGYKISAKSTKTYGNLLLLETKDFDVKGRYISVHKGELPTTYDYFCLVRMKPVDYNKTAILNNDFDGFMKNQFFSFDFPGFLTYDDFVNKIIKNSMIIPQGYYINDRVKMDAENYYCQVVDLMTPREFLHIIKR